MCFYKSFLSSLLVGLVWDYNKATVDYSEHLGIWINIDIILALCVVSVKENHGLII